MKDALAILQGMADWLGRNFGFEIPEPPPPGFKRIRLGTWTYEYSGGTIVVFNEKNDDWYWSHTAHVGGILKEIDSGYAKSLTAACAAGLVSVGQRSSADQPKT